MSAPFLASFASIAGGATLAAILFAVILTVKSTFDYTRTGPLLPADIVRHFRGDAIRSLLRLGAFSFLVSLYWALWGAVLLASSAVLLDLKSGWLPGLLAGMAAIFAAVCIQFTRCLFSNPGILVNSSQYRISRFYSLWRRLSPRFIRYSLTVPALLAGLLVAAAVIELWLGGAGASALTLAVGSLALAAVAWGVAAAPEPEPGPRNATADDPASQIF